MAEAVTMYRDSDKKLHETKLEAELADACIALKRYLRRADINDADAKTVIEALDDGAFTMLIDDFLKKKQKLVKAQQTTELV